MSLISRLLRTGSIGVRTVADLQVATGQHLAALNDPDNPKTVSVCRIENGFLLTVRSYNPNGPDHVLAHYAADITELSAILITKLTQQRLTK
jgi:hypothetical protein